MFRLVILILLGLSSLTTMADEGPSITEIAEQGRQIQNNALDLFPEMSEYMKGPGQDERVELPTQKELSRGQLEDAYKTRRLKAIEEHEERFYLFVSRNMPDLDLVEVMRVANGRPNVFVVFRGIFEEENLMHAMKKIRGYVSRADGGREDGAQGANVLIDPKKFKTFGIETVPEMILARGDNALIRARGIISIDWMEEQRIEGQTGDLGNFGTTVSVTEIDLIELMQKRVLGLNFDDMKRKAIDRFWTKFDFRTLPRIRVNMSRKLDPTIVTNQPLKNSKGEEIVKAGKRINPLMYMPFTHKLMIFDSTDQDQVRYVANWLLEQPETQQVQLITTQIKTKAVDGWDWLGQLENYFKRPVYVLTDAVQQRFSIRGVPSVVRADGLYFFVDEIAVQKEAPTSTDYVFE